METQAESVATETTANTEVEAELPSGAESAPAGETVENVATPVTPEQKAKNQERIDNLTRDRYQALSRAEQAERRAKDLEDRLAKLESSAKPQQVAPAKFPTLEEHGYDEAKYIDAVQSYFQAQQPSTLDEDTLVQRAIEKMNERQTVQTREQTWKQRESEFAKSKPDFVEKVYRQPSEGGPRITESMLEVILESEMGPEVAYHLAENVEVSEAIARMSPVAQAREIGRIEARLEAKAKAPPPPPVSKAPPPVKAIEPGEAVLTKDPDDMDDKAWGNMNEKRRKAEAKKRADMFLR